jgi:hypothetical protein
MIKPRHFIWLGSIVILIVLGQVFTSENNFGLAEQTNYYGVATPTITDIPLSARTPTVTPTITPTPTDVPPTPIPILTGDPINGKFLFESPVYGCSGCHTGIIAPDVVTIRAMAGNRLTYWSAEEYICMSIIYPSNFVVDGYQPGLMPQNFGERLYLSDLSNLVAYLSNSRTFDISNCLNFRID